MLEQFKNNIIHFLFKRTFDNLRIALIQSMDSYKMDKLLESVLFTMSFLFKINKRYRKNIKDLNLVYSFKSEDGIVGAAAIFKKSRIRRKPGMIVKTEAEENADITITFKDGHTMADFLFAASPDIFTGILDSKLSFEGNLNYILKFAYLARRILKELKIEIDE